ncbi:MAG: hypothetical protein V1876_01580, partial [Candidatus Peregrinibacteria bacterium]
MDEHPQEADGVRVARSSLYLPPPQRIRLLAHAVNGCLEQLLGAFVDRRIRQRKTPQRTEADLSAMRGESPEDYALRRTMESIGHMPDSAWQEMAKRSA